MTRRLLIIAVMLVGLVIGYLAGCRSHVQSRTLTHDPQSGQHWHDRDGSERIVRGLTRKGEHTSVWWYRANSRGADRHCTIKTWQNWVRAKGAVPE